MMNIVASQQTLVTAIQVDTNTPGPLPAGVTLQNGVYTLDAQLPACEFQVDATVGALNPNSTPIQPVLGNASILDGALGVNDCPGGSTGDPNSQGPTRTQGYWKNHPEVWAGVSLTLGTQTYTQAELLFIFNQPVRGNGAISLAHQLIAAKLNMIYLGSDPNQDTLNAINQADQKFGNNRLATTSSGGVISLTGFSLSTSSTSSCTTKLDNFNQSGDNLSIPF